MFSRSFKIFQSIIITYLYHPIERATTPAATAAPHPATTAVNKNTMYKIILLFYSEMTRKQTLQIVNAPIWKIMTKTNVLFPKRVTESRLAQVLLIWKFEI